MLMLHITALCETISRWTVKSSEEPAILRFTCLWGTAVRLDPAHYLIHGGGDDQSGWLQFREVQQIADKSIADGIATPMVIFMPDANTGRSGTRPSQVCRRTAVDGS